MPCQGRPGQRISSLKSKYSLSCDPLANTGLQGSRRGQLHSSPENIGETVLQTDHIQEGLLLSRIELSHSEDASPRATEPKSDSRVMPGAFNSGSYSRCFAITADLSITLNFVKTHSSSQKPRPPRRQSTSRARSIQSPGGIDADLHSHRPCHGQLHCGQSPLPAAAR